MKKELMFFLIVTFIFILAFSSARAELFDVEKTPISDVIPAEVPIKAQFDMTIKNNYLQTDNIEIFTLIDMELYPSGPWLLDSGASKQFIVNVVPKNRQSGTRYYSYYIKGQKAGSIQDTFELKIMPLRQIMKISVPDKITLDSTEMIINFKNTYNTDFGKFKYDIDSSIVKSSGELEVHGQEEKTVNIPLTKDILKVVEGGTYLIELALTFNEGKDVYKTEVEAIVEPKSNIENLDTTKNLILGVKKHIKRLNSGNVQTPVKIEEKRFLISKLVTFTTNKPDYVQWKGLNAYLVWERNLQPGQTFETEITTSYLLPILVIVILIISLVVIVYLSKKKTIIAKSVKKVETTEKKVDEFALKVNLHIKNRTGRELSNVVLRDRLPHMAKIYEKYGSIHPTKVSDRLLIWELGTMSPREEREISYIIYAKVEIVGKFKIPQATLTFKTHEDAIKTETSNSLYYEHKEEIQKENNED